LLSLSESGGGGGGGGRRWRGRWRGLVWGNVGHDFRDHAVVGHPLLGLAGIQSGLVDRGNNVHSHGWTVFQRRDGEQRNMSGKLKLKLQEQGQGTRPQKQGGKEPATKGVRESKKKEEEGGESEDDREGTKGTEKNEENKKRYEKNSYTRDEKKHKKKNTQEKPRSTKK